MEPQQLFCLNPDCPARGKANRDNIGVHRDLLITVFDWRYICPPVVGDG